MRNPPCRWILDCQVCTVKIVNEIDYDELVVTAADYWSARLPGRVHWSVASSPLMCAYQRLVDVCIAGTLTPAIQPGDAYFVTGDRIEAATPAQVVLCASCADGGIPDAAFGLD